MDPVTIGILAGGGLASAGFGAWSSHQERKAAERAAREQREFAENQADLARNYADIGQGMIGDARDDAWTAMQDGLVSASTAMSGGYADAADTLNQTIAGVDSALTQGADAALGTLNEAGLYASGAVEDYNQAAFDTLGSHQSRLAQLLDQAGGLYGGFEFSPGYQHRLQQAEQAINRSAAAQGGRLGGNTLQALQRNSQGMASDEYGRFAQQRLAEAGVLGGADAQNLQQLGAMAGIQQGTGSQLANILMGVGSQGANIEMGLGGQRAGNLAALGSQFAGMQAGAGQNMANLYGGHGNNLASLLYGAGRDQSNTLMTGVGASNAAASGALPSFGMGAQGAGGTAAALGNAANTTLQNLALWNQMNKSQFGTEWAAAGNASRDPAAVAKWGGS